MHEVEAVFLKQNKKEFFITTHRIHASSKSIKIKEYL